MKLFFCNYFFLFCFVFFNHVSCQDNSTDPCAFATALPPSNVTITEDGTTLYFTWDAPENFTECIDHYQTRYSANGGTIYVGPSIDNGDITNAEVVGISSCGIYLIGVAAVYVNDIGTSTYAVGAINASPNVPSSPTSLEVTETTPGTMYVSWGVPTGYPDCVAQYILSYKSSDDETWTNVTLSSRETNATINGLSCTTYNINVTAENNNQQSDPAVTTYTTAFQNDLAISSFNATSVSTSGISFTWNLEICSSFLNGTMAINYDSGVATVNSCSVNLTAACDSETGSCSFDYCTDLEPCQYYDFQAVGNFEVLETARQKTLDSYPGTPQTLTVSSDSIGSLTAVWSPPDSTTCLGFYNYTYYSSDDSNIIISTGITDNTTTNITVDEGLTHCDTYIFEIWAVSNYDGLVGYSVNGSAGIMPTAVESTVASVIASVGSNTANLTWPEPTCAQTATATYDITASSARNVTLQCLNANCVNSECTAVCGGLVPCLGYSFNVEPTYSGIADLVVESTSTDDEQVTQEAAPTAPQNLIVTPLSEQVLQLTWQPPSTTVYNCDVDGYQAQCITTVSNSNATTGLNILYTSMVWNATGLVSGTSYDCSVMAHNANMGYGDAAVVTQNTNGADMLSYTLVLIAVLYTLQRLL